MKTKIQQFVNQIKKVRLRFRPPARRLLFNHIPKCGGTSITSYLRSQYPSQRTFLINGWNPEESLATFLQLPPSRQQGFDLIIGHRAHNLLDLCHPEMRHAIVFREPVERIISHYYFVCRMPRHDLYETVKSKDMTLLDYATSGISAELENFYVCQLTGLHPAEVARALSASVDQALSTLKSNYTFVGTLDNLDEFMQQLDRYADFAWPWYGLEENKTIDRPIVSAISSEVISAISKRNEADIMFYQEIRKIAIAT